MKRRKPWCSQNEVAPRRHGSLPSTSQATSEPICVHDSAPTTERHPGQINVDKNRGKRTGGHGQAIPSDAGGKYSSSSAGPLVGGKLHLLVVPAVVVAAENKTSEHNLGNPGQRYAKGEGVRGSAIKGRYRHDHVRGTIQRGLQFHENICSELGVGSWPLPTCNTSRAVKHGNVLQNENKHTLRSPTTALVNTQLLTAGCTGRRGTCEGCLQRCSRT